MPARRTSEAVTSGNARQSKLAGGRNAPGAENGSVDTQAVLAALRRPRGAKYHNVPTVVDGERFDSKREADRYRSLKDDLTAGRIRDLEIHPRFPLVVHGESCGDYVADFSYLTRDGQPVVEDVKSAATRKLPTYRLKAKLLWALYGLRVTEVT